MIFGFFQKSISKFGKKIGFFPSKFDFLQVFLVNHSKNLKKKMSKTIFRKNGIKSRCGGPRPKFLATPSFLIEILWKNNFEVGGPLSTIWCLFFKSRNPKFLLRGRWGPYRRFRAFFFKSRNPKFLPSGKKRVFCVAVFFESATKTTVLFFRGAPIFFV